MATAATGGLCRSQMTELADREPCQPTEEAVPGGSESVDCQRLPRARRDDPHEQPPAGAAQVELSHQAPPAGIDAGRSSTPYLRRGLPRPALRRTSSLFGHRAPLALGPERQLLQTHSPPGGRHIIELQTGQSASPWLHAQLA